MLHDKILASQIGGNVISPKFKYIKRYNKIIILAPHNIKSLLNLRKLKLQFPKTQIILWWIGSDVMNISKRKQDLEFYRIFQATHLCVSEELRIELLASGIKAKVLTLIPNDNVIEAELPEKYTVACYIPSQKPGFYNFGAFKMIAQRLPGINFILYGNKEPLECNLENVDDRGWVNGTRKVVEDSNCLLRLTDHDGFPKSIIEFMKAGRYVITNHDYPYVDITGNVDSIVEILKQEPVLDDIAKQYYRDNYYVEEFKKQLYEVF